MSLCTYLTQYTVPARPLSNFLEPRCFLFCAVLVGRWFSLTVSSRQQAYSSAWSYIFLPIISMHLYNLPIASQFHILTSTHLSPSFWFCKTSVSHLLFICLPNQKLFSAGKYMTFSLCNKICMRLIHAQVRTIRTYQWVFYGLL